MRLVVDSNALFAALLRDSTARRIFLHLEAEFFVISMNYAEFEKHKEELLEKSGLGSASFEAIMGSILARCIVIEDEVLLRHWKEASQIMDKADPFDTSFIAAALASGSDIWSDDSHFEKQNRIKIWKTGDLAKLL